MKKYLISIENEESLRYKAFISQKNFSKYRNEFIKMGVKGRELSVFEYYQHAVACQEKPLTPGELGCTLSHVAALKDFINSDEKYALVFEDDVTQICDLDLDSIEENLNSLRLEECFFFSLGGIQLKINNRIRGEIQPFKFFNENVLKLHPLSIKDFSYAFAYILDKKMAYSLLKYHEIPHVYDHWGELLEINSRVNFYATYLFDHPEINEIEESSTIEKERRNNSLKSKKKKNIYMKFRNSVIKKWLNFKYNKFEKNSNIS